MRRFASLLGVIVLTAVACAAPSGQEQATQSAAASETPVAGGRIVVGSTSDIKTCQPIITTDTASQACWDKTYSSLLRNNRDTGELEASLADKWSQAADGLSVSFTLRDNLVWSDGTPVTGEDFRYTVEATMRSKKTTGKTSYQDVVGAKDYQDGKADSISGITVSGDGKTINVKLGKVFCPALRNINTTLIPKHKFLQYWDNKSTDTSKNIDDNPLNMAPPVGTGPFLFKELKPGDSLTLVKNPRFFRGEPLIDEYIIKIYGDQNAIKAALLTGEITFGSVTPADIDEVKKSADLTFYRFPGVASYAFLGWNNTSKDAPWLGSKAVRQALWYGLNVDAIMQKLVFGYGVKIYTDVPPASWVYDEAGLNKYPYDVSKAKQLIESTGAKMGPNGVYLWTDGRPMKILLETNQPSTTREQILQVAQEQYKQIGIEITPLLESFPALVERSDPTNPDFQATILGWSIGLDPDTSYSIWHSSQRGKGQNNFVNYVNPEVDKALDAGRNGPDCSQEARKKQYLVKNKALNEDAPYTFLYVGDNTVFANKALRAFEPKPYSSGSAWNYEKWWLKK